MIKLAFRKLFRKGEYTTARIISLAVGLAFGLILLGEVLYYYSFDGFYPDANNIYVVQENFKQDAQQTELDVYPRVSGAIGPGLMLEVPGVKVATRLNTIGNHDFFTKNKKLYRGEFVLADEHWPDVLPRPMISGNAHEILTQPMQCMISEKLATKMGGNIVGKTIELKDYPNKTLTIAGVFETLPENTNYSYDVLISMVSIKSFTWDGTKNWLGNDRYYTCVRLEEGVTPESLTPAVRKMQEKHQEIEEIERKQPGFVFKYTFAPLLSIMPGYFEDIILILSIIALSVLFVALMNYVLLTISSLVNRAKNSAIYKCYGAKESNLRAMILAETVMVFFMALSLAVFIIYISQPFVEQQVGHKISSMYSSIVILPLGGLLLLILGFIGYFPGRFFAKIPVATAFRNYRQKGNKWKLALLSIQFLGATFILTLLVIVSLQYNKMQNADHGYQADNVFYASTSGMSGNKISTVLNELTIMSEVEEVGLGYNLPIYFTSGNNIFSQDRERELFNVADFYYIDENYMNILGIPITEGSNFNQESASPNDILISQLGANKLIAYNKWTDGIVGKNLFVSEHNGNPTICGIFPDFVIHSIANRDPRPAVFFYRPREKYIEKMQKNPAMNTMILIKTVQGHSSDILEKLTDVINIGMPFKDAKVRSLKEQQRLNYQAEKGFRNTMLIGNVIILLITFIGLLGYTLSEVNRRRKDLAIRKIHGATVNHVLRMFLWDLERMAIPAVLLGILGAWWMSDMWMENFSEKVSLHWYLFLLCSLVILLFVGVIAIVSYWKPAKSNPVNDLRYE